MNPLHTTRSRNPLSRPWRAGLFGSLGLLALSSVSGASENLLKTGNAQPLADLDFLTPFADAQLTADGGVVVRGDFDGDGQLEAAFRDQGYYAWRINNRDVISDYQPYFDPSSQVTAVGDFDGNGVDEIAWRLAGCPFWVLNSVEEPLGIIYDGIPTIFTNNPGVSITVVGDFNGDGADELAWRQTGFPGWVVNGKADRLDVIFDFLTDFDVSDQSFAVGDFNGDGADDVAWRRPGADGWNANSVPVPLFSLNDGLGTDFDPGSIVHHVGDFDGDEADDIAWRGPGGNRWVIDSLPTTLFTPPGTSAFEPPILFSGVGDFDGDGIDELAWRSDGGAGWIVDALVNPTTFIPSVGSEYDSSYPHHIGDFNGDGKDDIAVLSDTAEDIWDVDTQTEDFKGSDLLGWQEGTEAVTIELELGYADVDGDGETDDYILLIKGENGDAFMIHKPLAMAYFLMTQGMTVTEAFYDAMSPEQQAQLIEDTQEDPKLEESFQDSSGGVGALEFNQVEFNFSVNCINEMEFDMAYVGVEGEIPFSGGGLELRVFDFSASGGFGNGMYGGDLSFTVEAIDVSYGPVSGGVYAGQVSGKAYVSDQGFALGAGATLVGANATVGNTEGSHVSAGVGFGIGAGAGAAWGENDQYGAEVDVKFISLAVYVHGDDAVEVYDESKDWIVGAANDTADWSEVAFDDASSFAVDTIDTADETLVVYGNDLVGTVVDVGSAVNNTFEMGIKSGGFGGFAGAVPNNLLGGTFNTIKNSPVGSAANEGVSFASSAGSSIGKATGLW